MAYVRLLLFAVISTGSFAYGNELPPGPRVKEIVPAYAWESFISNLPYLSYNNHSIPPSFVWFEELSHSLVHDAIDSNFRQYYSHKVGENIELHYHHFEKSTQIEDDYAKFWIGNKTSQTSSVIEIPGSIISDITQDNFAVLLLATFKRSSLSQNVKSTNSANERCLNSDVISASLLKKEATTGKIMKQSIPVRYEVEINEAGYRCSKPNGRRRITLIKPTYSCEYYDLERSVWSDFGCSITSQPLSGNRRHCSCNHTTSFAIILSLNEFDIPIGLEIVIQVVEVITVIMLLLTIIIIVLFRRFLESDRFITQLGIAISLMFLHLFFLIGSLAVKENIASLCIFSTIVCHLCTIYSAIWMLNEAIMLSLKIRNSSLRLQGKTHKVQLLLSGWLFPALYVAICVIAGFTTDTYIDNVNLHTDSSNILHYDRCWLSSAHDMTLSVIIPLAIIFTINSGILIATVRVVRRMDRFATNSKPQSEQSAKAWKSRHSQFVSTLRASIMLFPVLGVPWLLGFLVNIPGAQIEFIAIHGVVNGLQGLFVFLIFCFKNNQLREATKRKLHDFTAGLSAHNDSKKGDNMFI